MGYQDRDYYRDGSQGQFVTSVVVKLIILNVIVFLADVFFGGDNHTIANLLAVHSETLLKPLYWWQFLTAGFVHSPGLLNHILFNMLGLYFFGKPLEERFGSREFLRFYLIAIVLGMIVWGVRAYLAGGQQVVAANWMETGARCMGASGGVTAVVLLFCVLYPRATILHNFLFPIPAWLAGTLIIVNNLFGVEAIGSANMGGIAYDVHLVGAVFALSYWYFGWNFGSLPGLSDVGRLAASPKRWFQPQPNLKVHDPEQYYEDLDTEADRILDKLHREGESSLSAQEKRTLEDYSRRMRQKLR